MEDTLPFLIVGVISFAGATVFYYALGDGLLALTVGIIGAMSAYVLTLLIFQPALRRNLIDWWVSKRSEVALGRP